MKHSVGAVRADKHSGGRSFGALEEEPAIKCRRRQPTVEGDDGSDERIAVEVRGHAHPLAPLVAAKQHGAQVALGAMLFVQGACLCCHA